MKFLEEIKKIFFNNQPMISTNNQNNMTYLWKYIPAGKHVLLRELELPDDWTEQNGIYVKKATAREGFFFSGIIVMVGNEVTKWKQVDIVMYNIVEGFRFPQLINGKQYYFRIIHEKYIIPVSFKLEKINQ